MYKVLLRNIPKFSLTSWLTMKTQYVYCAYNATTVPQVLTPWIYQCNLAAMFSNLAFL